MNYYSFQFTVNPVQPGSEVLIALLADQGFESFVSTETGFDAFIQEKEWKDNSLENLGEFDFTYSWKQEKIEQKNWNEEWENNFHPVEIEGKCKIRAPFHPPAGEGVMDVIIMPKMSFGTGHHQTTRMMSAALFDLDVKNKIVLDMGCGTGVLAIVAEKLGAKKILAIDIDEWSVENSIENAISNHCKNISVQLGNVSLLQNKKFEIILANINRNILLADLADYKKCLNQNGFILLSGFFENDIAELDKMASSIGIHKVKTHTDEGWAMLVYQ